MTSCHYDIIATYDIMSQLTLKLLHSLTKPTSEWAQRSSQCIRWGGSVCTLIVTSDIISQLALDLLHSLLTRNRSEWAQRSSRGDGRWGKKEKTKRFFLSFWYPIQGLGLMAHGPQAGTGDSMSRFRRYHCSTVINYNSYFLVGEIFAFNWYLRSRSWDYCQLFKTTYLVLLNAGVRFHSLRCSEILISPSICTKIRTWSICTKIRTWRLHRTEEVSNNFSVSWHITHISMAISANLGRDTDHNSTKLVCDYPLE